MNKRSFVRAALASGRYVALRDGRVLAVGKDGSRRVLSPSKAPPHPRVTLCIPGARMSVAVHVVIAEAFLPSRRGAPIVAHKNGNSFDNRASNLIRCTHAELVSLNRTLGKYRGPRITPEFLAKQTANNRGERNPSHKLTSTQVSEIKEIGKSGLAQSEIAAAFRISQSAVSRILGGSRWSAHG